VAEADSGTWLLCRAGAVLCALPVAHVIETMRLPPLAMLPGTPSFVAGMSMVRGAPLPVIVVRRVFGEEDKRPERLVVARVGDRRVVGIAVDAIVGVRTLPRDILQQLPSLLGDASHDAVAEIGTLDGELMVVLRVARIVPAEVFAIIQAEVTAS